MKATTHLADCYVDYFCRAYDVATSTTNRSRHNESEKHSVQTRRRNLTPHVGERQRERARRQIASGYLRTENGLR